MIRVVSGQLGSKHRSLAEALTSATTRLSAGEAPTDDAEQDWTRLVELDGNHHAREEVSGCLRRCTHHCMRCHGRDTQWQAGGDEHAAGGSAA
jgi:hypothetical protein